MQTLTCRQTVMVMVEVDSRLRSSSLFRILPRHDTVNIGEPIYFSTFLHVVLFTHAVNEADEPVVQYGAGLTHDSGGAGGGGGHEE